ncbi:MAG: DUF1801 domain-containing protein [Chloroflexota bacterium]|nr:DUF1801 domain-containing protein [Chloroflexota bacterium]
MIATPSEVEALIAGHSPKVQAVVRRLRELIYGVLPEVREQVDTADHLLGYATGPRMRDLLFAVAPHTRHVNLQLADGALLPDPDGIVEGTGKRVRHVKCRSPEDAERPAVLRLIEAQAALRGRQELSARMP